MFAFWLSRRQLKNQRDKEDGDEEDVSEKMIMRKMGKCDPE